MRYPSLLLMLIGVLPARAQDHPHEQELPPVHLLIAKQDKATKLFGYSARDGRTLPAIYVEAQDFADGHAVVKLPGGWGAIDSLGHVVVEAKYAEVWQPADGWTIAFQANDTAPCLVPLGGPAQCVPFATYWKAFEIEMHASNIADKELILRVLQMQQDPRERWSEMKNLEATYAEMTDVRTATIKRVLAR